MTSGKLMFLNRFSSLSLACMAALLWANAASASDFSSAGKCRFPKRPPVVLKGGQIDGFCKFDHDLQLFGGTPRDQARCLLNPVEPVGRLAPAMEALPAALGQRVGGSADLPSRETLAALLRDRGATKDMIDTLAQPVSHAHDNDPLSRSATYIVFHDTSTPNYRTQPWPTSIDDHPKINNLARYECSNDIERAHVFINRGGQIFLAHDFTVPWRATKFETAKNFGTSLKGLFLHIELIQPRRALKGYGRSNDFLAPKPGFSQAQYDSLALVYAVASRRAGFWMIPAFHSVLDEGIRNKHDDPQNFELEAFAQSLDALVGELRIRTAAADAPPVTPTPGAD
jgi:hypothetical protein